MAHCTVDEVKARLEIDDSIDDDRIALAIDAATAWIDRYTSFQFAPSGAQTRYFTAFDDGRVEVGPLTTLTSVAVDYDGDRTYSTVLAASDYELGPFNATALGRPYTDLYVTPLGSYRFPIGARLVKVVGVWGGVEPGEDVREACRILAVRLLKRGDAPFGVAGIDAVGGSIRLPKVDPDVLLLLRPYRRFAFA